MNADIAINTFRKVGKMYKNLLTRAMALGLLGLQNTKVIEEPKVRIGGGRSTAKTKGKKHRSQKIRANRRKARRLI